ncbi:LysB family phage lysis regulatory protein [Pseudomonas tolaasii]|uniref:LysB family phage lysis regulatory protein n=2 Tax=Pseudomonas tolaasii TaxID=29442 RepID=A0A7Y8AQ45_PSETO|nr:Rz-like lysis system protein LysB [Pseudomonas tolaasii]KAB0477680.1 LysB family phage lysis regulatory protein [Pseudomonas tolaasii]MBY8941522.1 LysB family phage lysis regulatory protein [Pseudomonas tolaasii]NWC21594.1 LysB family phage lysis regulatory protein [Pseudomonas tolaasii]NWC43710.1 LysB family phage lysis regulatory protein [Pseudomonas tolaasii]NWD38097.1 LysB family phage lysis regulatory protein [Pseudomonas tolaasii]
MITLRQTMYGTALLGAMGLLIWIQETRIDVAEGKTEKAQDAAKTARDDADRNLKTANTLTDILRQERDAQSNLRAQQDQLRLSLAKRERTIEELKLENDDIRKWADQLLPDAARRLRERPAITGAAAYRDWLSGRGAVPTAGDQPSQ